MKKKTATQVLRTTPCTKAPELAAHILGKGMMLAEPDETLFVRIKRMKWFMDNYVGLVQETLPEPVAMMGLTMSSLGLVGQAYAKTLTFEGDGQKLSLEEANEAGKTTLEGWTLKTPTMSEFLDKFSQLAKADAVIAAYKAD